ncbi:hypothetical protein CH252_06805 [Rhodococcus sp. 06-1477-1B]|nr:hypothetical protein CH252_06805 [Rhodococcus sp. 06-1477-1B]
MTEPLAEKTINLALKAATRSGLHTAPSTARGVAVEIDGREFSIAPGVIEQIVSDTSPTDISRHVETLRQQRMEDLALDPAGTTKLRYTLALGVGPARLLTTADRQLALSRTYFAQSRLRVLTGANRYLDKYTDLPRGERESLLWHLAETVLAEFKRPQYVDRPSSTVSGDEGFDTIDYVDQHVIPTQRGRRRTVTRTRRIRANRDGVTEFRRSYFVTQTRSADPLPHMLGAGSFRVEHKRPHAEANGLEGYKYDVVVAFPSMKPGEERTLQWIVDVDQPELERERRGTQTVTLTSVAPIDHALISVRLDPALPVAASSTIDGISPHDVDLVGHDGGSTIVIDGYVQAEWTRVQPGLTYGIAWCW